MKKLVEAGLGSAVLSAVLFAATARAQTSSVTLYGVVDAGVEYLNHAGAQGAGAQHRISSGNEAGSRWGIRGSEDLGSGLSAVFVLESGYNTDTGSLAQGGRLFGRQAFVGMKSNWGTLSFGRHIGTLYEMFLPIDPIRFGTYGLLAQDGQFLNRTDNSIKYSGNFGNLTILGLYSAGYDATIANGGEVPGSYRIGQEIGTGISYTAGSLGMAVAYDQRRGTTGSTQASIERRYAAGLTWASGPLTLMAGYRFLQGTIASPGLRGNLYWLGGSYNVAPSLVVRGGVFRSDPRKSPNDAMSYVLSAYYNLSKRTDVYLNIGYMSNQGTSNLSVASGGTVAPGVNQTGVVAGVRHSF